MLNILVTYNSIEIMNQTIQISVNFINIDKLKTFLFCQTTTFKCFKFISTDSIKQPASKI